MSIERVIHWAINCTSRSKEHRIRRLRRLSEKFSKLASGDGPSPDWQLYHGFPKTPASSMLSVFDPQEADVKFGKTAIVMQGPIVYQDDMTLNSMKLYRQTMPNAILVLSTWHDVPSDQRSRFEDQGVHFVESEPPSHRGPQNINLQLASTARGIQKADQLGCDYILKTRCDTRIHLPDLDLYLQDLLKSFPVSAQTGQLSRIITLDFATRMYIPHHPSDVMMFGSTEDLVHYWNPTLFGPEYKFVHDDNFGRLISQPLPEVMMCTRYLQSLGQDVNHSLDEWWQSLSDRFIVVDRAMIGHFWLKDFQNIYQPMEMQWDRTNMALCHFPQWLQMHHRVAKPLAKMEDLRSQQMYEYVFDGNCRPIKASA